MTRDLGAWILPQAPKTKEYVAIPKFGRTIPFGYKLDEANPDMLLPIPSELEALEKAKKHLKRYSLREVAAWLSTLTGRSISHVGLSKRIKDEQSYRRRSKTYRKLAEKYKEALKKAQAYEKRVGSEASDCYFELDSYIGDRDSCPPSIN
jgi:zona occludens toxin (predicted ATPase)